REVADSSGPGGAFQSRLLGELEGHFLVGMGRLHRRDDRSAPMPWKHHRQPDLWFAGEHTDLALGWVSARQRPVGAGALNREGASVVTTDDARPRLTECTDQSVEAVSGHENSQVVN